jgi:hypothetical protein
MSLRAAIRLARKKSYGDIGLHLPKIVRETFAEAIDRGLLIGLSKAQGISFDLTTPEGRAACAKWHDDNPLKPPPWESDDQA